MVTAYLAGQATTKEAMMATTRKPGQTGGVMVTREQVARIRTETKAGRPRRDIAADLGLPPERVSVVQSALGLRRPNPEREARDKATLQRWLDDAGEPARKMAATKAPAKRGPARHRSR
jgi:hypothetical protein